MSTRHAALVAGLAVAAATAIAPRAAHAYGGYTPSHGCLSDSLVVGRDRCRRFGDWATTPDAPSLTIDAGIVAHHALAPNALSGSGLHYGTYALAGDPSERASDMLGPRLRFIINTGVFFAGGEFDYLGAVGSEAHVDGTLESKPWDGHASSLFAIRAVAGVHQLVGPVTVGTELAAGIRWISYRPSCGCETTIVDSTLDLEARVRADVWISSGMTAGVSIGTDVFELHDTSLVVSLAIHTRGRDGQ